MPDGFPKQFGRYRLLRKLAQGGMAEIFLAQDDKGRICAIKRILPHLAQEESFIRMFIDEARIVSHLDHPNIAAVYDQGKERQYYYIAMEFVQGHSLLALSERAKATKMDLPRGLLAFVVAELLAGLGCAHAARDARGRHLGIVHRDVTPQNVLIAYDGAVKLVDFGVAKARSRLTQTEAGFTKGKLAYMSPEQARGEELDGRSDLFSVGIILHEITTNARLFNKEGPGGILGAIVNDPIPRPSARARNYPKELERIVMRALEKDVGRRYQTGEDMRDDLLGFARRERPTPSRQRLGELVFDLFGPAESQSVLDRARELAEPTPAQVAALPQSVVADAASVVQEPSRREDRDPPAGDETRMMEAGLVDLRERPRSRVVRTDPGVRVESPARTPSEVVPMPKEPWRVRLGRFLRDLLGELALSTRTHPGRWRFAAGLAVTAVVVLGALASGWVAELGRSLGRFVEDAKMASRSGEPGPVAPSKPTGPRLEIESVPPGASIVIDGLGAGKVTPDALDDLPVGRPVRVQLGLAGHRTVEEEVLLRAGERRTLRLSLEREAGDLMVTSQPPGARILLNGKDSGRKSPHRFEGLPSDPVRVEARAAGHRPVAKVAVVRDGATESIHLELPVDPAQIPSGRIDIDSQPVGCAAFLDDERVGTTPVRGAEARPGRHVVRVECEHHGPEVRSVLVQPSETAALRLVAEPDVFGYLTVEVLPARGSVIEVSGSRAEPSMRNRKVVPGRHVVTVRNPKLRAEKTFEVRVRPNERIHRQVRLP